MNDSHIRLLIAEDEDSIRGSLERYIRKNAKYIDEIYSAQNGQEALDLILRYRPQLMLLDIQMPLKDGLTVLKEASAAGVCPKTIILSGHDAFSYAQQAIRYGVADYLLKPCRSTEILEKLEELARPFAGESAPETARDSAQESAGNPFVAEAVKYMREHYPEQISQPDIAAKLGLTAGYLSSLFTKDLGYGFADCLNRIRIERACDYFVDGSMKTYEVAFRVGFHDEKYFSSVFKRVMGLTPSQYRKGLRGKPEDDGSKGDM